MSWVAGSPFARITKVIAVADVVESVRLMEQDEGEFIRRWQHFVGFVRQRVPLDGGRMHKSLGDGLMLEFSDPQGCIRAALAMQQWFAEGNQGLPLEQQVQLRIGAHVGDFVADEYDIYGTDVNLTARIATLAGPGEIVVSSALRERLRGGEDEVLVEDLGACHLKHVRYPVHAYRVGRAGRAPVVPSAGPSRVPMRAPMAVLPFETSNAPAGCSQLGEAVADEAVAALSRSDALQVVSRLSTAALKTARPSLDEVRRHLGTRYVLSGHAREIGGQLAVFAELADADTGHIIWADSFKGALSDLLAGDTTFLRALPPSVSSAVMANEMERAADVPLPALEGYALLLAAVGLMHRLTPPAMERARLMLEHLAERDRRHAAAYAWLSHWHVLRVLQGWSSGGQDADWAGEYGHAALRQDPQSPLALCMAGHAALHLSRDVRAARGRYAQALATRPDDPLAHMLQGELLAVAGDGAAARAACARALELGPPQALRHWYEAVAAFASWAAGDVEQAAACAGRSLRANARFVPAHCILAAAQYEAGQTEDAGDTFGQLLAMEPRFDVERCVRGCALEGEPALRMARALRGADALAR